MLTRDIIVIGGSAGAPSVQDLFGLPRRASGIHFNQYKTPTVKRRLLRRMACTG